MHNTKESWESSIFLRRKKNHSFALICLDKIEGKKKFKFINYLRKIGLEPYSDVEDDGRPVICADVSQQNLEGIRSKLSWFLDKLSGSDTSFPTRISSTNAYAINQNVKGTSAYSCDREFTFVKSDDVEDLVKAFDLVLTGNDRGAADDRKSISDRAYPPKDVCGEKSPAMPLEDGRNFHAFLEKNKSVQAELPKKKFWHSVISGLSGRKSQTISKASPIANKGDSKARIEEDTSRYLNLDVYTQTKSTCSQDNSRRCCESTSCSCTCPSKSNKNVYTIPVNFAPAIGGSTFFAPPRVFILPKRIVKNSKLKHRSAGQDFWKSSSDTCACASSSTTPVLSTPENSKEKKGLEKINLYMKGTNIKQKKNVDNGVVSLKRLRIVKAGKLVKLPLKASDKLVRKSREYLERNYLAEKKDAGKTLKAKHKRPSTRKVTQLEKLRKELRILSEKVDNLDFKKVEKVDASVEVENCLGQRSTNDVAVECIPTAAQDVECANAATEVDFFAGSSVDADAKGEPKEVSDTSSSYININTEMLNNMDGFMEIRRNLHKMACGSSRTARQEKEVGKLQTAINRMKSQIESKLSSKSREDDDTNGDYHFCFSRPKVVVSNCNSGNDISEN